MKQPLVKSILGGMAALLLSVGAQAATIWQPTDVLESGSVNIIQLQNLGGSLALFEDTDVGFAAPLVLGNNGGVFEFTDNMDGTFSVAAFVNNLQIGAPLVMTGSAFSFAVDFGAGYVGDVGSIANASDPTTFLIAFDGPQGRRTTLAVDITPSSGDPVVPLPAAAWLFGSALLGLAGIKRKKKA